MSIERRIKTLETRAATRTNAPTDAEATAAYERVVLDVCANFIARLKGLPVPLSEELEGDYETVRRYGSSKTFVLLDPSARERLKARIEQTREDDLARGAAASHRSRSPEARHG